MINHFCIIWVWVLRLYLYQSIIFCISLSLSFGTIAISINHFCINLSLSLGAHLYRSVIFILIEFEFWDHTYINWSFSYNLSLSFGITHISIGHFCIYLSLGPYIYWSVIFILVRFEFWDCIYIISHFCISLSLGLRLYLYWSIIFFIIWIWVLGPHLYRSIILCVILILSFGTIAISIDHFCNSLSLTLGPHLY